MTTARTKRRSPLPPAVRRYLAAAPVCRLATASADGEPHVIPVCPVFDGVDTLYVDIGPKYRTAKHIAENPRATVLIDDYSVDWSELRRVILRCRVRIARGANVMLPGVASGASSRSIVLSTGSRADAITAHRSLPA